MEKRSQLMDLLTNLFNYAMTLQEQYIRNSEITNLSISEIHVIEAIELENEPTMSNVANRLLITTGTLTTSTNKIIQKGYLEKYHPIYDKRVFLLKLTENGKRVFEIHKEFHEKIEEVIMSKVNEKDYPFIYEILTEVYGGLISHDFSNMLDEK